jgi:hypothetical protein
MARCRQQTAYEDQAGDLVDLQREEADSVGHCIREVVRKRKARISHRG